MASVILNVPDISCGHCVQTINRTLAPVQGISRVSVNIPERQVRVDYDPDAIGVGRMKELLAEEDYPVASVAQSSEDSLSVADQAASCACCQPGP